MPAVRRCPSLGLDDDQDTCMTFATESHHCYRLAKHKAVPVDHQLQYCLNENHIRCPIFLSGDRLFPKAVRTQTTAIPAPLTTSRVSNPKSIVKWAIAVVAIFVFAFVSWWVFAKTDIFTRTDPIVQASGDLPPGVTPTNTRIVLEFSPDLTLVYDLTAIVTVEIKMEATQSIPVTGIGSMTATATIKPSDTPVKCALPDGWVVYTVKLSDTLYWLSQSVDASVEEIIQVNCLTSEALTVEQQIYLPKMPPKITNTSTHTFTPTIIYYPPTAIPSISPTFSSTPANTKVPAPTDTSAPQPTSTPEPLPTETPEPTPTANPEI